MVPIAIPPITPPTIAPAIAAPLKWLLPSVFVIEVYCGKALSVMLVVPVTQRETTGPVRVAPLITPVGATRGGKED